MSRHAASLILLVLAWSALAAVRTPRCYWPDGTIDTRGYVCNTSAVSTGGESACCLHDDACYDNGSCFQDWSGITYRQSCTDATWRSDRCPQFCLANTSASAYVWVQSCDLAKAESCCVYGQEGSCCNAKEGRFTFRPGYITAVISGDGSNRLGPYVFGNGSTRSGVGFATCPTVTSLMTGDAGTVQTGDVGPGAGDGEACQARNTSTTTVVVGVVLGALLAAALGGLCWLWRLYIGARRARAQAVDETAALRQQADVVKAERELHHVAASSSRGRGESARVYEFGQGVRATELSGEAVRG